MVDLTEHDARRLAHFIEAGGDLELAEMVGKIGASISSARNWIGDAAARGLVERFGPRRYIITGAGLDAHERYTLISAALENLRGRNMADLRSAVDALEVSK